jgi:anaerobic ribonucleoside-triphosphate reductase activating protein
MSDFNDITLNIGKIAPKSRVNGPGVRFTIWLQGCPLRCKGCINKEFWSNEPNQPIKVSDLFKMILDTPNIEGVTYSGGEPFEQAEGLYILSSLLKDKGLSLMAYSGYTYEELMNSTDSFKKQLLTILDILVDGRYEQENRISLLWRGSSNQNVYFLTPLYKGYQKIVDQHKLQMEFSIDSEANKVSIEGNFSQEILEEIQNRMKEYGINI